jgi:biotin synthase
MNNQVIQNIDKKDLIGFLSLKKEEETEGIFKVARDVRNRGIEKKVYTRGLIELSNKCIKNCLYCGLRSENKKVERYELTEDEVLETAIRAKQEGYTSLVIQSGERTNKAFIEKITAILKRIHQQTNNHFRITLSCGEQTKEVYKKWFEAGANRYLLRLETSNKTLFEKIHPKNDLHSFTKRLMALESLKKTGFQTGSGFMIGIPGQTIDDLANDLLFLKNFEIDMVGMGPFIMHEDTPMTQFREELLPMEKIYELSLLMISSLRLLIPKINIAAATALDSIKPIGRLEAIWAGANVLMPNITPLNFRDKYFLYNKKAYLTESAQLIKLFKENEQKYDFDLDMTDWGDSKVFSIAE